ncbi:hypothetical protein S83_034399 [Arachis hypogaea]
MKQQVTIWWSGLMRGAVSIALAYNQFTRLGHTTLRENAIMITSTISVVLFSTAQWLDTNLFLTNLVLLEFVSPSEKHKHNSPHYGYPSDADKHLLAWQTGLSRNQIKLEKITFQGYPLICPQLVVPKNRTVLFGL